MGFFMDISDRTLEPLESERRRSGATGAPVILADGQTWLLARPNYRPTSDGLTQPPLDRPLDRVFERAVTGQGILLADLWELARTLLRTNYELSDVELSRLLSVAPGPESTTLAADVLDAVGGGDRGEKTYTAWVRATLLANGLGTNDIPAQDLANVLTILVATNRTIPLLRFADACRLQDEQARLETLI